MNLPTHSILCGTGHDSIYTSGTFVTISGNAGNDHIENKGNNAVFNYVAGDGNDTIYGFDETSKLNITGGESSITLKYAAGKTININGKSVTLNADFYDEFDGTGFTKIDASQTDSGVYIDKANKAGTLIGDSGNDVLISSASKSKICGNEGDDELHGSSGNDYLYGGAGNDSLWGGLGKDTFIYKPGEGTDKIFDYTNGIFTKAAFASSKLTLTIDGGGNVLFDYVSSGDKININGTSYTVKGKTLK